MHTSAHKEQQAHIQDAYNRGRAEALNEAFAFLVEHRDSALTREEMERAFAERFFETDEGEPA